MKSDSRVLGLLIAGLMAILTGTAVSWFLANFELRPTEIDTGYSPAARHNDFLAAQRFLRRLGIEAESLPGRDLLRNLPPPGDVLVVNGLEALNSDRQRDLHQWLSRGGHLLVRADRAQTESDEPHPDDFLTSYGVVLAQAETPGLPAVEILAKATLDGHPQPLEVGFSARSHLLDSLGQATGAVEAEGHYRLLQFDVGRGLLTVTSDNSFLNNRSIGNHDNALFLALLVNPGESGKVWLLYDSSVPWLGALLWERAPYAVASAFLLVLLLLWHRGERLGPLLPSPERSRRDLLENLEASAAFLWRHGLGSRLTASTRTRIEKAWLRRYPHLRDLGSAERAGWIARRAGVTPAEVTQALYPAAADDDLANRSLQLQRLWSALSGGGAPHTHVQSRPRPIGRVLLERGSKPASETSALCEPPDGIKNRRARNISGRGRRL